MKSISIRLTQGFVALLFFAVAGLSAQAQTWPSRPINLVVGFAVGGSGDTTARIFAQALSEQLGQPVIIENKSGSGGAAAVVSVSRAPPDGYTILVQAIGPAVLRPILDSSVTYDSAKDLTSIGLLSESPNVILAGSKFPVHSIRELVDWAKKNPGRMTVGHPGPGTMGQLGALLLASKAGITGTYVAYRSGGQILLDIVGGQIDVGCAAYAPAFKSANILAVMTPDPVAFLPGVPSMREAGFPGVYASTWYGVFGPPNMPRDIVMKLNAAMNKFLQSDDAQKRLPGLGVQALGGSPDDLLKKIVADKIVWSKVIKDAHISLSGKP